jgi:hypothetical protein
MFARKVVTYDDFDYGHNKITVAEVNFIGRMLGCGYYLQGKSTHKHIPQGY